MAGFIADWPVVFVNDPPPQTPDGYRIYRKYQGAWLPGYTETFNNNHQFDNQDPGEHYIRVYGLYDGETSQAYATESIILEGTPVPPPENGAPPPDGNAEIAAPETVTLTPTA